ncbi:MAG TPA: pitrilysin family protein [Steroidobacteraceae bacterium]|nr:pitrilysin family protein [Steroidobacteraceae bacterium]
MRGGLLIGFVAVWLAACVSTAQPGRTPQAGRPTQPGRASPVGRTVSDLPDLDIPSRRYVLGNGLTLIVHEDHKAPVVAVDVWYHVGSKDERPGRTGFAHLFEHLMFTSSEDHKDEFFRPLLAVGATKMNGNTWLDRTTYFENVPVNALDTALWLESDRMGHLLGAIDQKKLDEQRGVVQNEKRQEESRPYGKVDDLIAAASYPAGHPYSWTAFGSIEDLNHASLEDVKDWFRTYYGAANAVLVVAGDVQAEEVRKKVEHYFGDIAPGPLLKHSQSWVAKMSGEKRALLQDRVPQARIYQVWNIPGYATHDFTLLQVAADILAGGKNSRLYKRLVYRDQSATAVSANIGPFEIGSQFQLITTVRPGGDPAVVERAIDEEIARFIKSGPTQEELERTRMSLYAGFVRSTERIDGSGGKASILGASQLYAGSPDFYRQSLSWLREASVNDVQDVARSWLSDGVFVLNVEPVPDYHAAGSGADRSKPPIAGPPPPLTLPQMQRATLSNGLHVAVAERHSAPVVQVSLIVDAGHAADSLATPGMSNVTLAMLMEGTRHLDALQIAAHAEALGAEIGAGSSLDTSYISLNALTSQLEGSLELFADVLLNPTFPRSQLEVLKLQAIAAIEQQKFQPRGIASRLFPKLLYGAGHAYANPFSGIGTEQSIRSITVERLREFYGRWIRPDNSTLLIVGDTTLTQIVPLLERQLAAWSPPAPAPPTKHLATVPLPQKPRVFLVNRTGAEQSLVMAAQLAPPRADPDNAAFEAINAMLGGNFVSRINMNLREDKHWSYGAGSSLVEAKAQRPFVVSAMVQTDETAQSMQEILRELREFLGPKPATPEELQFAKNSLVLTLPGSNETAAELAGSYADILTYGLPDDYLREFSAQVQGLTSAKVHAAATRLIHPESLTWIVVGDLASIEPAIRKLGMGQVQVLDPDGNLLR